MKVLNLIDGIHRPAHSSSTLDDIDPSTGDACASLPDSDAVDIDEAVAAAERAFTTWKRTPAAERSALMLRLAEGIEHNLDELARLETCDTGKPLCLSRSVDIPRAAANLRFFATAILHETSESAATDSPAPGGGIARALNLTLRAPRGPAGCISPWNLPLYLFTWKIAPALATGNTVVGKPSEVTPLTAFRLGQLSVEVGFPPGVLNIVHGLGSKVGAALGAHPGVPAITFTGGTATGAAIAATAAPMFKKLSLELGGKNPTIIFDDVDLDEILPSIVRSAFLNQGQICLCGSRILVHQAILNEFLARFVPAVAALRVGDPLESSTDQGAVVSRDHLRKIESAVDRAKQQGATVLHGGHRATDLPARVRNGFFYSPTILTGVDINSCTAREEIFGPVVTIHGFADEAEAVQMANSVDYGLSASIWTRDGARALRVASEVDAGTVWINCWLLRDLRVPFGGMKHSGVGREGGLEALHFFTEPRNVCIRI